MLEPLIRAALRARSRPAVLGFEKRVRAAVPPLDRAAKRAYARFKTRQLVDACSDPAIRAAMLGRGDLPDRYGLGMDERVVEYPWVLARVPEDARRVFDAGSTLNFPWVADHPAIRGRDVIVCTLAPEGVLGRREYSYLYGDLRDTVLRDACADACVCISTLEHVGMDNTAYTGRERDREDAATTFTAALTEIRRVLRPGAPLLLTVPFGRYQDLGWLQQFDASLLRRAVDAFAGELVDEDYFRHDPDRGWHRTTADACADAAFLDVRGSGGRGVATMATAIACLRLRRPAPEAREST